MKKYALLLLAFAMSICAVNAQSKLPIISVPSSLSVSSIDSLYIEKTSFIYQIVFLESGIKSKGIKVKVDDGEDIKKLKDSQGESIVFKTPAAALMYFLSQGWDFYMNGSTVRGGSANGYGSTSTSSYWILRKPCSQEELENAVKKGLMSVDDLNF